MSAHGPISAGSAAAVEVLVLDDGTRVALRELGAADRAGLADLFGQLSPESRRRRFLSPKPELTSSELTYLTEVDHFNHEAVAAVDERDDSVVGVARYVRHADRPDAAELAIEVADAFQGLGIGTALTGMTIRHADANGLRVLTATTLWENASARALLRHHGFRAVRSRGGEIEHELQLGRVRPGCTDTFEMQGACCDTR